MASRLDLTVPNCSVSNPIRNWCTRSPSTNLLRLKSLVQLQFGRTRYAPSSSHKVFNLLATSRCCHQARVGSLAWNNHILTCGSIDQQIIDHELRARDHVVVTYRGHQQEICSLKWSPSSQHSCSQGPCLCPFESNLLVSGGGERDECIKFWNTHTGACLKSVDCGSQVPCLLRSKNKRELLSSHGYTKSQLSEWKYPSLVKMVDLTEHTSTVLFMTQSPDGRTVASAAASGDERLLFLNMFEPLNEKSTKPFTHERDDLEQILSQYCIEDSVSVEIHSIT